MVSTYQRLMKRVESAKAQAQTIPLTNRAFRRELYGEANRDHLMAQKILAEIQKAGFELVQSEGGITWRRKTR